MTYASIIKALLDKDIPALNHGCSDCAAVKSILFSREFFEMHAPYLRQINFSDEQALMSGRIVAERKTIIGVNYIEELMKLDGKEFVQGLYRLFLRREAEKVGLEVHCKGLQQKGKADTIKAVLNSPEALSHRNTLIVPRETREYIMAMT